jgi:proline dehydrogenase
MFTLKLLLNPVEEARQDALSYINQYAVKLTSNGNMIMFRRIVSVADTNKELVEFISKQYVKVKSWKKSPQNYTGCIVIWILKPIIYCIM